MATKKKMLQAAAGNAGGGTIEPVGVDFDGGFDRLSRASDLVGNVDGKEGTAAFWIYANSAASNDMILSAGGTSSSRGIKVAMSTGGGSLNGISFQFFNTSDSQIAFCDTISVSKQTWIHILASWDLAAGVFKIYVDDVEAQRSPSLSNANINYTNTAWGIANLNSTLTLDGRLAGVYLDYTYRDLSVEANRRDFIDADGLYVTPPTSGIISVPMDDPADPGRNDGTGGDFTLNGTVARSGRGPDQYNVAASTFDGGADYMENTSISTPTTKEFTFSAFIKLNANNNGYLFTKAQYSNGVVNPFELYYSGSNIRIRAATDVGGTVTANYTIPSSDLPLGKYVSVQISFDLTSTSNRYVLVNGNDAGGSWTTYSNTQTVAGNRACVGGSYSSTFGFDGDISDLYFDTSYIDLATYNPFYDAGTNKPKYLGASGELPTGSSPLIYLPLRADDAGNNLGTGGDFTVNSGPYVGARGASEFLARSAEFDGSTGYLSRAALTGAADSKTFSLVVAFKPTTSATKWLLRFEDSGFQIQLGLYIDTASSTLIVTGLDGATATFDARLNSSWTLNNTTIAFLSVDLDSTSRRYFQTLTVGSPSWERYIANDLGFSGIVDSKIGRGYTSGTTWDGDIGSLYLTTDYIDFNQEANRLKFVDGLGYPVDLQPAIDAGDIPTPLIHMKFDDTSALGTNSGSGGDFTVNGTVTAGPDVKG
jgi:hypothetical protein